jgi:hypothetical protein
MAAVKAEATSLEKDRKILVIPTPTLSDPCSVSDRRPPSPMKMASKQ